jgi:hypothetical protein
LRSCFIDLDIAGTSISGSKAQPRPANYEQPHIPDREAAILAGKRVRFSRHRALPLAQDARSTSHVKAWNFRDFPRLHRSKIDFGADERKFDTFTSHCISMKNMILLNEYSIKRRDVL